MTPFDDVNRMTPLLEIPGNWTLPGFSEWNNFRPTIRSCPFCGSDNINTFEPKIYEVLDDASVKCGECGAEVHGATLAIALRKWNRRVIG